MNDLIKYLSLEKILEMDEKTFHEVIQLRFSNISKEELWLWKCNALRAMVNSNNPKYHPYIKNVCRDNHEKIRALALWACEKSGK